jgi:ribosomal protein S18 acetylase RimI-like enzyme
MPGRQAAKPYHLHSMAVEPDWQKRGLGREMLTKIIAEVVSGGGDLIWATARPTAVGFYQRCGFEVGEKTRIQPTNAPMQYVWTTATESSSPVGGYG